MGIIQQLPEEVVRKIAAGEVIVRPANAVKELIENSLDARSTEISVHIRDGGLTLLQVKDNGCGIFKDDLPLVCERFATSKLRTVDDLSKMTTFGFRGEALASIAMVSSLNVTSKRREGPCAFQIAYKDGCQSSRVRPSAGGDGTTITVEGMFAASEARRRALKNHHEEGARVLDVVSKYAVHRPDVSFVVRRDDRGCDLRSIGDGSRSTVLRLLYGDDVAKDPIDLALSDDSLYFDLEGVMSRPYSIHSAESKDVKKKRHRQFVLFINNRPVSCATLKTSIETTLGARGLATTYLLIALKIEPSRVDVNVHPTKDCVFFLQQDDVIEKIQTYLDGILECHLNADRVTSLVAPLQLTLHAAPTTPTVSSQTGTKSTPSVSRRNTIDTDDEAPLTDKSDTRSDHTLNRISSNDRRLDQFFLQTEQHTSAHAPIDNVPMPASQEEFTLSQNGDRFFTLASLQSLRQSIVSAVCSDHLRSLFKEHYLVGCPNESFALLQHDTSLYAVKLGTILEETLYQLVIFSVGNLGSYRFSTSLPLIPLLAEVAPDQTADALAEASRFLFSKADMLNDFFSISFEEEYDDSGEDCVVHLTTIPSIIHGHTPQMAALPEFLLCLLVQVDWDDEEKCIEGIARSLAAFYSLHSRWTKGDQYESSSVDTKWSAVVENLFIPKIKDRLLPLSSWSEDGTITTLTTLPELYKIFERC